MFGTSVIAPFNTIGSFSLRLLTKEAPGSYYDNRESGKAILVWMSNINGPQNKKRDHHRIPKSELQ
jgi:hypothetical protein